MFSQEKNIRSLGIPAFLLLISAVALWLTRPPALHLHWTDESIYFASGENIATRGDFNSQFYIADSVLKKGYPTKDTHTPGWPMFLALAFWIGGIHEATPYILNYLFLFFTLYGVFFLGTKILNPWAGLLSALLYLIFPLTLPMAQSAMSDTSAVFTAVLVILLFIALPEGWMKGACLALGLSLAYLVRQTSLSFALPIFLFLVFSKRPKGRQTLLALSLGLLLLFFAVLLPLSSNREIYPFAPTEVLEQGTLDGMWNAMLRNLNANLHTIHAILKPGEWLSTLAYLGLFLLSSFFFLLFLKWPKISANEVSVRRYLVLGTISLGGILPVVGFIFFIFEFQSWRGPRALEAFAPLLCIQTVCGLFLILQSRHESGRNLGRLAALTTSLLVVLAFLGYAFKNCFAEMRFGQIRDFNYFNQRAERFVSVLERYSLKPKVALSFRNFFIPVRQYPLVLVWTLPRNLAEFSALDRKLPVDFVELSRTEAQRVGGNKNPPDDLFGEDFRLLQQDESFVYYIRKNLTAAPSP